MTNVIDYLKWRGDLPIVNGEINEVDAVILSRLSYLPFDGIVSASIDEAITLREAAEKALSSEKAMSRLLWPGDEELMREAGQSERFGGCRLSGFVNYLQNDIPMQFSAIIIELCGGVHFVSFRGTDNTIIGWQEDFNLYTTFPLPSQLEALSYFESACKALGGSFILGGHSKGGNLAIFSACFCIDAIGEKILSVYNLDGPGFDLKAMKDSRYELIKDRIHTFVPQSSIVGMILEHEEDYTIIKSAQKGFFQHDIFSWEVERTSLVKLSEMTSSSLIFDRTLRDFAEAMTPEERQELIEVIFKVLRETDDKTFNEILENWVRDSGSILKSITKLSPEAKNTISSNLGNLIKIAGNNFADVNPIKRKLEKARIAGKSKHEKSKHLKII